MFFMELLYHSACLAHDTGFHPENEQRLIALVKHFGLEDTEVHLNARELIALVHPPAYISYIEQQCRRAEAIDSDTIVVPASFSAALKAVELTVQAAHTGGFALVRPPGHHAHATKAHGFCLFNNMAIATQQLVSEGKRVAIFDFDGHLGDGTEAIFYDTDQVLFWSTHQYPAFPFGGFVNHIGEGKGKGYTINMPLPPGAGDDIFKHSLDVFLPVLQQFQPDVVAVSAGFDAHEFDPILNLSFSHNAFYDAGRLLRETFPDTPIFAVLEGGYNIEDLPRCAASFLAGVNGQEKPYPSTPYTESGLRLWETYEINAYSGMSYLKDYWTF